ncbi:HD-GYP domain-containing protein [Vibrio maerlii]|uniref:HD-GYP domain-containing protein n=1 Tax=Vibrio maerlii TaxID=2231648 RepID=UPI000E3CDBED|nr:HD-GYP domain-containing protein [Vibrio maerlii]
MTYKLEDSIKISIDNLSVGMFVTAIENSKRVNLTNAGRVTSKEAITRLRSNQVKFAWVDRSLSAPDCIIKPVEVETKPEVPETVLRQQKLANQKRKLISRESNQRRAKKVLKEAKSLAQKLINQTFESKVIDVSVVEDWADEMIESALVDSDALQCVSALRKKDSYLLEHSVNVSCLLVSFGKHLGFEKEVLKQLAVGGIIHDIGKVKVDDKVLHKPGRLTPEEFDHMKLHQVFANQIIDDIKGLSPISRDVCLMHHEKLDGTGYPNGLKGDELTLYGRLASIIDIYDALTADRVYKKGMTSAEAFKIILSLTPNHLDSELVYKFINCIGMYPVGSLVELSDGRVAIVWTANSTQPLKPEVKCFYSNKYKRYTDVTYIDLKHSNTKIVKAISPNSLNVDVTPFYD